MRIVGRIKWELSISLSKLLDPARPPTSVTDWPGGMERPKLSRPSGKSQAPTLREVPN